MAGARWFYAEDYQRRGPVSLEQLVESVLTQREPRTVLVWQKGCPGWTRAGDVAEVEDQLAPVLERREAEEAERRAPAPAPAAEPASPPASAPRGSNPLLLYGGLASGIVMTGLVAWLLWPGSETAAPAQVVPLGGTTAENAPAVVIPAPAAAAPAAATPAPTPRPAPTEGPPTSATKAAPAAPATPAASGVGIEETDLPSSEVRKLRQVAVWSGTRLELTVVNDTEWRVTELSVQVQSFVGNEMVENERPILLLPPGATVDDEVASLLSKVAPDRRRPGVNPLDTGKFSGEAGPRPDAFRCDIVSARGYPPR